MGLREAVSRRRLRVRVMFFCTGASSPRRRRLAPLLGGEWAGWACSFVGSLVQFGRRTSSPLRCGSGTRCPASALGDLGSIRRDRSSTARFLPEDGYNTENLGAVVTRQALASPGHRAVGTSLAWAIDGVHGSAIGGDKDHIFRHWRRASSCARRCPRRPRARCMLLSFGGQAAR